MSTPFGIALFATLLLTTQVVAQQPAQRANIQNEAIVESMARGTFTVKLTPVGDRDEASGARLGRMAIAKTFTGDIEAAAQGEMLTTLTDVEGSAGYVAMERVSGVIGGRRGSFVLQHNGVMTRGAQQLSITVVPDSGTGDLRGIVGVMTIDIAPDGTHAYTLTYGISLQP